MKAILSTLAPHMVVCKYPVKPASAMSASSRLIHGEKHEQTVSLSLAKVRKQAPSFPKSLSISSMLHLGKVMSNQSEVTVVDISKFDTDSMTWSVLPMKAEFVISKEHFGQGGFWRAYRATSTTDEFKGQEWVVKKYLPETLET